MGEWIRVFSYVLSLGLIGGIIGYATNVLAVKMLFKPVKKRCLYRGVLCIQGLIPARKDEIAERLGEAAAQYALSENTKEKLMEELSDKTKELIKETLSEQLSKLAPKWRITKAFLEILATTVAEAITPGVMRIVEKASGKVDVSEIVKREFKSLPTGEIETIFVQMAGKELRFIELAGFFLGFIVGLVEGVIVAIMVV